MGEPTVQWDDVGASELRAIIASALEVPGRPADVYEEWLAATKVAYTQGG